MAVKSKPPAVRVVVKPDLKMASGMQEEYLESATVTKTVTIVYFEEKKGSSTTLDNSD
jgi:hypothetical protein